jgi:uncharacterized membrane protein YczE
MDHKKAHIWNTVLFLSGIFVSLFLYIFDEINTMFIVLAVISISLIVCGYVIAIKYYRCPHCHRLLPLRSLPRTYCPDCGEKL